jgi:hypothetical protein
MPTRLAPAYWLLDEQMLDPADYPFCSEFYIVEKSIEVVANINGEDRQIRIDVLPNPYRRVAGTSSTSALTQDDMTRRALGR